MVQAPGSALLVNLPLRADAPAEAVLNKRGHVHRVWDGDHLVSITCNSCGEHKQVDDFGTHKIGVGGKQSRCKACRAKAYRDSAGLNREAERRRGRVKYAKYRADSIEYSKRYRKENFEAVQRRMADYRQRNAASLSAYSSAHKKTPEGRAQRIASRHRRRALRRAADCGCVTSRALQDIWGDGVCAYCDAPAEHYDHELPLFLGGLHCISNLRPACASCNTRKGKKSLEEFLEYMDGKAHSPIHPARNCPNQLQAQMDAA